MIITQMVKVTPTMRLPPPTNFHVPASCRGNEAVKPRTPWQTPQRRNHGLGWFAMVSAAGGDWSIGTIGRL